MAAFESLEDATEGGEVSEPVYQPEPVTPEPEVETPETPEQAVEAPTPQGSEEAAPEGQEPADSFIDPNTLPPELLPQWRLMNRKFTQTQQEFAEQRRMYEGLGDPETLQQAAHLHRTLSDPQNWPVLHEQLSAAMQERGLTPAQADVAATATLREHAPGLEAPGLSDDPEMAALQRELATTRKDMTQMQSFLQRQAQAVALEREQAALIGEHQRMLSAVHQSNPHYESNDLEMVEEVSPFYDGDLFQAQARLEDYVQGRIERYLQGKQFVAQRQGIHATPAAGVISEQRAPLETLEDAQAILEARLREQLGDQ